VILSPALSQIVVTPGPVAGRKVGVIADAGSDLAGIQTLRQGLAAVGVTLLVIAPVGGKLGTDLLQVGVDRTLATARSIEFDAILVADGTAPTNDIKLVVLLQEAFRHCKAMGSWGNGTATLTDAGIDVGRPGVSTSDRVDEGFTKELVTALGLHRAWDRATAVMASAIPPSAQ
jgi:catalase